MLYARQVKPGSKVCALALVVLVSFAGARYARVVNIDRHSRTITAQMTALDVHVVGRVKKELRRQPLPLQGISYIHPVSYTHLTLPTKRIV